MKKLYFLTIGLFSIFATAQQNISFETSEGYISGNINGQNGWTVTETSDGPLTNQIISNEFSKTGSFSFKNAHVPQYSDQMYPIFGIEKTFSTPLDYKSTTISYDFYSPQQNGADFEFALYSVNEEEDVFDILLSVGFENRGLIYIYNEMNFNGFAYANATWQPNKWYNLKVEIKENTITYYLDNNVIFTGPNTSKKNINGMNFLHNNFGGSAFYDNITINNETLAASDFQKGKLNIYPNPVKNNLNFSLPNAEKIAKIFITNIAGQTILNKEISQNTMNLENLKPGAYLVTITNTKGISYTSKFIKE